MLSFTDFLKESDSKLEELKTTFLTKIGEKLEEDYAEVEVDKANKAIFVTHIHRPDKDKFYSIPGNSRPELVKTWHYKIVFNFDDKIMEKYFKSVARTSAKFGLGSLPTLEDFLFIMASEKFELKIGNPQDEREANFIYEEGDPEEFFEYDAINDNTDNVETWEEKAEALGEALLMWIEDSGISLSPEDIRALLDDSFPED
jgi:hypothetical protein